MGKRLDGSDRPLEQESVVFRLGHATYRMDVSEVRRVVRTKPITPCAREGSCLCGLVNVGGRIVPVFDMAELLQTGNRGRETAKSRIIVAEGDYGTAAFVVDSVTNRSSERPSKRAVVAMEESDAPLVDIDSALSRRNLV